MHRIQNILKDRLGVDRPIFYIMCGRAWGFIAGPITLYLITRSFTPDTQGYYYTFSSIVGLQVFLEMGFSQCIVQYASHEFAKLRFGPRGELEGDAGAKSRLVSLGRLSLKWYGVLALLLVLCVGTGGYFFFAAKHTGVAWFWPWWVVCVVAGVNLALLPIWSLLEGCNQLAFMHGYRLRLGILCSVVMWAALYSGAGLFAGGMVSGVSAAVTIGVLLRRWSGLLGELRQPPQRETISWKREIWPFQWRIAISWMSGYFIYSLFTPVLFQFHGPIVAGQMGMTLSLVTTLGGVSSAWVWTKAPKFGMLISQKQYKELDALFLRAMRQSVGICLAGGTVLLLAIGGLKQFSAIGGRFLPLSAVAVLVAIEAVKQIVLNQAIYVRAHKKDPYMVQALVCAVATGLAVLLFGWKWGALGACLGYGGVQLSMLPWTSRIYLKSKNDWHCLPREVVA